MREGGNATCSYIILITYETMQNPPPPATQYSQIIKIFLFIENNFGTSDTRTFIGHIGVNPRFFYLQIIDFHILY